MATYTPDINQMRSQYASVLADQQKKALRGVQDVYAGRGTTGSGEESNAFAQGQQQFGLGAGQAEAGLQQYLGGLGMQQAQLEQQGSQFGQNLAEQIASRQQQGGQFGQNLAEQARQFNANQGNWQQNFGEQQRQFNTNEGNWLQNFGLAQNAQQFGQNLNLAQLYSEGMLSKNPFAPDVNQNSTNRSGTSPFENLITQRSYQQSDPQAQQQNALAQKVGFNNIEEMNLYNADPEQARKQGIYSSADKTEIARLVKEMETIGTGQNWLTDHFGLTYEQAKQIVGGSGSKAIYTPYAKTWRWF